MAYEAYARGGDSRDGREGHDSRDWREPREPRERDSREYRDARESRDGREYRDARDHRDAREDVRDRRDGYDEREERENLPRTHDVDENGQYVVPDVVKTFVAYFYRHIREKNVYEIHQMYDGSWNKLSERMFTTTLWPPVEAIAPFVDNDHVFCLLYKEMYFRHVYATVQPTLAQRCESWENYCNLFQVILHGNVNMQLPNLWLWDMIDEFIYQFQNFCQYRAKLKSRTEEELTALRQCEQVWNIFGVLNYLKALIESSHIVDILEEESGGNLTFTATDGYDYQGGSNVLKVLGYFSIVGLLRVHCLLGDYHGALRCLSPIDINQQGVFTRVIGCHITTMYYYGFANMMMRRYVEAIKAFNSVLLYIVRTQQYHSKSVQYDQIMKKNEQMCALLAICLSLCPQAKLVEENIHNQLREKLGEKMLRMQRCDEATYDELFSYACPKFITPSAPNFDEPPMNYNQDAYRLQLKLFLTEVRQQQLVPSIRSFLKLYTTIPISKLASYMDINESTLRAGLTSYKHKTHSVDADRNIISNADIDFYIDGEMIHVVEPKTTRRFGDHFSRHILRFEEITRELERMELPV
ncbi:hypothetical protein CBR_g38842 [Chara braunii]|uniref:Eukaryotic translation initiation factor 3 subunit L n=1 Tax=Chara braunii TaxID=69332 RepID=A0A388LQE4_CHABU|nr:hypothetical protein CBR_g38842 [Chara braunii]|eukprot:GBG84560.1 hypothetical protein CBR_g38842 [Chara braunii]